MIALRVLREDLEARSAEEAAAELRGLVLAEDVGAASGGRIRKGTVLDGEGAARVLELEWRELHLLRPEEDDLHETAAGERLARAAAGDGVEVGRFAGGAWPLKARHRGILEVRVPDLDAVNGLQELSVHTHLSGRNVDRGETVARIKVIPFLMDGSRLRGAEARAEEAGGLVVIHAYRSLRVAAVVQQSLGEAAAEEFRKALGEKLAWFGSELDEPRFVSDGTDAVAGAIEDALDSGADLVLVAGARAMDPMDPAFRALEGIGAEMVRHGVPAHPGSLLWVARRGGVPVVGVPGCGLFSRATVFDLVLARALAGRPLDADALGRLGHGGLLTPEMAWRFPPYRETGRRGELG